MRNILTTYVSLIFAILFIQSCSSNQVENAQKLLDLKSYDQAIELLEKEIQEEPDNFEAHFTLANAFASKAFQNVNQPSYELIKKSISSYNSAAILKPNDFSVAYNLGVVLYLSGKNSESIENLTKALKLDPQHSGVHIFLSQVYKAQGNNEKAKEYFSRALGNNPMKEEWFKPKYVIQRESVQRGTFIVKKDSTSLYRKDNNEKSRLLSKYEVKNFRRRVGEKLFFTDTQHPIYVKKQAYSRDRQLKWLYRRIDERQFLQDEVPQDLIRPNSVRELRFLGWKTHLMSYEEITYIEKYVNVQDVIIGSGNVRVDKELIKFLEVEKNIDVNAKEKILEGNICKGMPVKLVFYIMGNLSLSEIIPGKDNIVSIYSNESISFIFQDGFLHSWNEK